MADTHSSSPAPTAGATVPPKRKRRWPRILMWVAICLVALLAAAAGLGFVWLRSAALAALPQLDGSVNLEGLSAPVAVRRDAHGVPHIAAENQADLFLAQGYVTAQDRLWQMDIYRRNANGDLAEIMGPALVKHDETERVLQMRRTAERIYKDLPPAEQARLNDYARGVNLYIAHCESSGTLPVEFRLLMYRPKPWSGVDSISIGLMEVQVLDTEAVTKLTRGRVAAKLHNPKLEADLYPVGSWRDHPPTGTEDEPGAPQRRPAGREEENENGGTHAAPERAQPQTAWAALEGARALLKLLGQPACNGCAAGSNEWVVAGSHTASGKPLLSNDMHMSLTVPNIWYMAGLRAPGFHAAGVTLPGVPYVIAGHNEHVAWGFTALEADVQDLYIEKLDGKGDYQAADGSWKPLAVDHELIRVRGGRDVNLNVELTDHGPLVNPLLSGKNPAIALKWTLYDPALSAVPLYAMNTASNWREFSAALAAWCWPTQNVVYADDQGHIAYHAVGKVPIRPGGLIDVPIEGSGHEWDGYIPFDDMPHAFDPPSGFLATANSRVTTAKSPYPLTLDWIGPYRVDRIYNMLDGRYGLTPKDMLAVQTDIYSGLDQEFARRFASAIDHTPGREGYGNAGLRQAADLMRNWDGRLTTDSAAASIETKARAALWPLMLKPKLGKLWTDYHWGEANFAEEQIVMHGDPEWLPPGYTNWNALLTEAVRKGMEDGHAPVDLSRWAYGSWHVMDLELPLARFLPLIGRIAGTGPQPMSGDGVTVKQVGRAFGPSQRFTMDWSNIDGSTENIVLGESGNPLSPYFRDQWKAWYGGTTFPLPFSREAVAAATRHMLRLLP
jgi:penicillin G amidase